MIAERCKCGMCDEACKHLWFKTCCGACWDDGPFPLAEIVWPLREVAS